MRWGSNTDSFDAGYAPLDPAPTSAPSYKGQVAQCAITGLLPAKLQVHAQHVGCIHARPASRGLHGACVLGSPGRCATWKSALARLQARCCRGQHAAALAHHVLRCGRTGCASQQGMKQENCSVSAPAVPAVAGTVPSASLPGTGWATCGCCLGATAPSGKDAWPSAAAAAAAVDCASAAAGCDRPSPGWPPSAAASGAELGDPAAAAPEAARLRWPVLAAGASRTLAGCFAAPELPPALLCSACSWAAPSGALLPEGWVAVTFAPITEAAAACSACSLLPPVSMLGDKCASGLACTDRVR